MKITLIGTGAAGNKAAIACIEKGTTSLSNTYLINSTEKDIPEKFKDNAIIFGDATKGGCGKERGRGRDLILSSMQNGNIDLDSIMNPDDDMAVIVSSVEGGSGSATVTILGKYIKEVLGKNVCLILLFGFEDDTRGLQNSIEVVQELEEDFTVMCISNKKFLSDALNNKIKAEKLANEEVATRVKTLIGANLVESEQNIDETDLYKVSTTPGYMEIGRVELPKIKNQQSFNECINSFVDDTKSLDIDDPTAKRLAVLYNINPRSEDNIDFSANVLRNRFGTPYEYFQHIQYTDDVEYIEFIVSGMDLPITEVKDIYNKYLKTTEQVSKNKMDLSFINNLKGKSEDAMFNMSSDTTFKEPSTASKNSFFSSFGVADNEEKNNKFTNTKKKDNNVNNY